MGDLYDPEVYPCYDEWTGRYFMPNKDKTEEAVKIERLRALLYDQTTTTDPMTVNNIERAIDTIREISGFKNVPYKRDLFNWQNFRYWNINPESAGKIGSFVIKSVKKEEKKPMIIINWNKPTKIEVLKPGKVVRVTFESNPTPFSPAGNRSYKQICKNSDVFDLRVAVAIAIVKDMGLKLTPEGNEFYARHFLMCYKDFAKIVDKAIKEYTNEQKDKAKMEKVKAEIKAIKERRRAKNALKRIKRREKKEGKA